MTAGCAATASAIGAHFLATDAILIGGSDDQKRRFLPAAAAGTRLGAYALTEPRSGSDPAGMTTRAQAERGGFRLTGTKHFITNGGEADFLVVFARSSDEPAAGISAFVVGLQEAASTCRHLTHHGIRGSRIYEVNFDCLVPRTTCSARSVAASRSRWRCSIGRVDIAAMRAGLVRALEPRGGRG